MRRWSYSGYVGRRVGFGIIAGTIAHLFSSKPKAEPTTFAVCRKCGARTFNMPGDLWTCSTCGAAIEMGDALFIYNNPAYYQDLEPLPVPLEHRCAFPGCGLRKFQELGATWIYCPGHHGAAYSLPVKQFEVQERLHKAMRAKELGA